MTHPDLADAPRIPARREDSVIVLPGAAAGGLVVVCDHAENTLPAAYGTLGLPPGELERHIAYDIGAAGVTRALAARLDAPAVLSRFSRLLIDPNRGTDDPTLVMRLSDGAVIPGNRHLDAAERDRRIAAYYAPYHAAIAATLDACLATGRIPVIVSIHTFTDRWKGVSRPWHAGLLWDKDPRLALPLIAGLREDDDLVVGDNEPYTGTLMGDCLWQHGTRRGLAHALIEIRQDLVADAEGQTAWAERLARHLRAILADTDHARALHTIAHYGSHADAPAAAATTSPVKPVQPEPKP